jgi:DNA-binding MarR family transcriptional regulator
MAARLHNSSTPGAADSHGGPKLAGASHSLGYQVRYVYRAFVKELAEQLAPHGLTTSQWSAMRVLWETDGLSQVELAQRMMVEKASLTSVLQSMADAGLITRVRNTADRRKVNIFLTAAGRRLREQVLPLGDLINKRATRGLSAAEVKEIRALLTKVMRNLQA